MSKMENTIAGKGNRKFQREEQGKFPVLYKVVKECFLVK